MTRRRPPGTAAALVAIGAATLLGAATVRAAPDGWTLVGSVSEELRGLTNPRLQPGENDETAARATTRLSVTLGRESPTSTLSLTGGLSPVLAEDAPEDIAGFLAPSLGGRLLVEGSRTRVTASLRGALTSTAFTDTLFGFDDEGNPDLTDPTLVTGSATRLALNADLGIDWEVTARDRFGLRFTAARIDFFDGAVNLVPTTSVGLDGVWTRALAPGIDGRLTTGVTWFAADNAADTRSLSFKVGGGLGYALSDRLSLDAGLGVSLTRTDETGTGSDLAIGLTGNLGLTWAGPDDSLTAFLTQGVQPSTLGNLQNTTAIGLRYARAINTVSGIGLDARFQLQSPVSGPGNDSYALRIGPYYSYQIDADTSLRLGYTFDMTDQTGGTASSHAVFLTLTRGFNLLQ